MGKAHRSLQTEEQAVICLGEHKPNEILQTNSDIMGLVRTAVSTSGPPAKAPCPRPSLGGRDCGIFHGGLQVDSGHSRDLRPHPGRTNFPEFLPIWDRTFPYHGNVAGGQLRQTGFGDETLQPVLPRQRQELRSFTNRLRFRFRSISEQPGLIRFRGPGAFSPNQ